MAFPTLKILGAASVAENNVALEDIPVELCAYVAEKFPFRGAEFFKNKAQSLQKPAFDLTVFFLHSERVQRNLPAAEDRSYVCKAASRGSLEIVRTFYEQCYYLRLPYFRNVTPLHYAAAEDQAQVVQYLTSADFVKDLTENNPRFRDDYGDDAFAHATVAYAGNVMRVLQ